MMIEIVVHSIVCKVIVGSGTDGERGKDTIILGNMFILMERTTYD